jgi:hypothetical protein
VDDVVVGGDSPAAGTFTTLNATGGGSLTGTWSDLGSVTTIDINGGTVDGTPIGSTTPSTGNFIAIYGAPQIFSKTIILPEYVQRETDVVPLLPVETSWAPQGIEVIKFGIKTDNASTYSCVLENWTAPNTASENISTVATAASREAESAALTYTVDAGNIVMVDLPTTTGVKFLQVWFVYKVKAS